MANVPNPKSSRPPTPAGTDDLLPTRRSLLGRLKDWRDDRSWQEFFDTYWQLIYNVALKAGLAPDEAEEAVQETIISVAKAMKDFRYDPARGSFKGWLLQLTGWRISNQFKNRSRAKPGAGSTPETDDSAPEMATVAPELERLWEEEWEQNLMRTALQRVRRQVNPRQFQIFDLYVLRQTPVKQIQRFLSVSAAKVYLTRHRVGRLIQKEMARLREQML